MFDQVELGDVAGLVEVEIELAFLFELVEGFVILGEVDIRDADAVGDGVPGGPGFAVVGFGAGGFLGVGAISRELFISRHSFSNLARRLSRGGFGNGGNRVLGKEG